MTHPYGYIRMTEGMDGDHVDCFLGPNPDAKKAYVIRAMKAGTFDEYDEDKVMLGFDGVQEAHAAFMENYSDPRFYGGMRVLPMAEFIEKVLATKDDPGMIKAASTADNAAYVNETALIRTNAKQPENQQPHPFERAEWTWPNAHPRCLRCGEEESTDGMCSGADLAKAHGEGLPWRMVKGLVREHQRTSKMGRIETVHEYQRTGKLGGSFAIREQKVGDGLAYKIMVSGQMAGHLSGFEEGDKFHLYKTEVTDQSLHGTGLYQVALQHVADQYAKGLYVFQWESSKALQLAIKKMGTYEYDSDKEALYVRPRMVKARVRTHTRTSLTGKVTTVREHDRKDRPGLMTAEQVKATVVPRIVAAAQKEYDDWDEANVDEYAGGGICHFIAEKIVEELDAAGIEAESVSSNFEQHVYAVAKLKDGVYIVDLPYQAYERGGGFSWTKIPGVTFSADDVIVHRIDSDPKQFNQYTQQE